MLPLALLTDALGDTNALSPIKHQPKPEGKLNLSLTLIYWQKLSFM